MASRPTPRRPSPHSARPAPDGARSVPRRPHRGLNLGRRYRRTFIALLTALALPLAALVGLAVPAHAAAKLTAVFSIADNGTWWKGTYEVRNGGDTAATSWKLDFDLPSGVAILGNYNGTATQSGSHLTVTGNTANASVPAGGSTGANSYYFVATGPMTAPSGCLLDNAPCDGSTDTEPPTAPGNLKASTVGSSSVSLSWGAATDNYAVVGYDIYNGATEAQSVSGATTSVSLNRLTSSTAYTFTVKARDAGGNTSPASNAVSVTTKPGSTDPGQYTKVGYFVQWGIYGRQYFVKDLDTRGAADRLDVLNYAFENINPTDLTCMNGVTKATASDPEDPSQGDGAGDADADYARPMAATQSVDGVADLGTEPLRGNFNQLKKLKVRHPDLKILVSLGGWTYSKYFSDAAATQASRQKFVSSCIDMYIKGNLPAYNGAGGAGVAAGIFDGFDIDWEWPGRDDGHPGNHYSANDKANLAQLLAEFRRQLDALGSGYLLTAFTPADRAKLDAGWDLGQDFKALDIGNIQGYDFHGSGSDNSWEPNRTGDTANLYADDQDPYATHFSTDDAISVYLDAGVDPRKLTIGIPFYGRGWQGVADGGAHGEWQSANGAAPGQFAEEAGTRGYANLLSALPNMTVYHDEQSIATYGYTGDGGQWWSFDDTWAIGKKTAYVKSKGLLGAMIWEMSGDTADGSLMNAVDSGLG